MNRPLKVLILEDVEADALLMVHELKNAGFLPDWIRVDTENSYLTALASGPDLILSDYNLPQFDAFLALQLMQMQKLDIPFIVISGTISEDAAVEFMKRGASDYLLKDRMARLGQAVVRALEQRELREEKRRTEEALRESEALYSAVVGQAFDMIFLVDVNTKFIVDGNIAFREKLGFSSDDLYRLNLYDIVAHDKESIEYNIDRIKESGHYFIGSRQYRCKDGTTFDVEVSSTLIHYGKKEVLCVIARDITQRRRSEEALHKSMQLLEKVYFSLHDALFIIDANSTKIIDCNPAASDIFGYSREDMLTRSTGFLHASNASLEYFRVSLQSSIAEKGFLFLPEFQMKRKDGTIFFTENSVVPLTDDEGKNIGWVSVVRDITERKRTESALFDAQLLLSAVVESTGDFIWSVDPERFGLLTFNSRLRDNFLETRGIHIKSGMTPEDLFPRPDFVKIWNDLYRRALLEGSFTTEYAGKTGPHIMELNFNLIKRDRVIIGISVFGKDITERKQAEEDLQLSEERFRHLSEASFEAIAIHEQGVLLNANDQYFKMFGYEPGEVLGKDMMTMTIAPEAIEFVTKQITTDGLGPYESTGLRKDGTKFPIEVRARKMEYKGRIVRFAAIIDISERKKAEETLLKKSEDLARSNADLAQFAYVASHDLQEPLRMVTSYVQLIEKSYKGKLDPDADEFIGYVVEGTKRMKQLLAALLDCSRVGTRAHLLQTVECERVLENALQNLRMVLDETKGTVTHDPLPAIMADEMQMVQLFQNLIGNGLKFHGPQPPLIHISAKQEGTNWIFSFQDNGIGIDPQYFEKIFVIFQRLHGRDKYPGNGIGLTIAKKIVERHGGKIWVESLKESGTAFYFTIPCNT